MSKERGCGTRAEGGLYVVCDVSVDGGGSPIDHFLLDPPIPWEGGQLRSPQLVESPKDPGVFHILLGVGKESYPYVPDFVAEGGVMGVSKRIPRGFQFEKLSPGQSRMILVHPRAIPVFDYTVHSRHCYQGVHCNGKVYVPSGGEICVHDLWPLSGLERCGCDKHKVEVDVGDLGAYARINTPSTSYYIVALPTVSDDAFLKYQSGLFLSLPIHGFDYISKKNEIPKDVAGRAGKSGWGVNVCED